jgi:NADH dehydrogenase
MAGADAFVNTYWIRFPHSGQTFDSAVANCSLLFDAARRAGVGRVVQVGVSNASLDSPLGYYRGKAQVEEIVRASGMPYAIARPTLVTGPHDVLTGNICWFLRRVPLIALPAGEGYRLQPIILDEAGRVIADAVESGENLEIDVAGPDILPFGDYVRLLAGSLGLRRRFITLPPAVMIAALWPLNLALRDTILTREELEGLRANLLVSRAPALGRASAIDWLRANAHAFGRRYVNDTITRFRPAGRSS